MASNFDKYKVLTERSSLPGARAFATIDAIPVELDPGRYNFLTAPIKISPQAQAYFDGLNLAQVAATAPDRTATGVAPKVSLFAFPAGELNASRATIRRNLPDGPLREHFVTAMIEVAGEQQKRLGGAANFVCVINLPGSKGILHHDNNTSWRSLWQPNHSEVPSDTTVVAHGSVAAGQKTREGVKINNYGNVDETAPELIRVVAPSSVAFWTGELLPPARIHAEPNIPASGRPRFNLIANPK